MDNKQLRMIVRTIIVIVMLVIGIFLVKLLFVYLYPFLIAFLLAIILDPIVTFLERKLTLSRSIATFLTIIFFIILTLFSIVFIGFYIFDETLHLLQQLPTYINELLSFGELIIHNMIDFFNVYMLSVFDSLPQKQQSIIMNYVNELITHFSNQSTLFSNKLINYLSNMFTSLSYMITIILFIIISLFFIMKDLNTIKMIIKKYVPIRFLEYWNIVVTQFKRSVVGLFKAQLIITFMTFIIVLICLLLFNIESAVTISIFAFFIDFIPYAGIGLLFVPWIVYTFFINNYVTTIQLTLLYMSLIVIRQVVEPKIIADSIGINPLIALIILFVSVTKWGIVGIIISPIILIVVSTINRSGIGTAVLAFIKR